jgi:hypothetical protein
MSRSAFARKTLPAHLERHVAAHASATTGNVERLFAAPRVSRLPVAVPGDRQATSKRTVLRRLLRMLLIFARSHHPSRLDTDRLNDHLRRDLGLTNHVEQSR